MALELNEHTKNALVLAVAKRMAVLLSSADSGYAPFFAVNIQPLWQAILILLQLSNKNELSKSNLK